MSGRIQYLLIVLLFALTCHLARHQTASQSDRDADYAVFMQTNPQNQVENTLVYHAFYAPEAMNDSQSEVFSYKAPAVTALLFSHGTKAPAATTGNPAATNADFHPRPADYYVFALEKILI